MITRHNGTRRRRASGQGKGVARMAATVAAVCLLSGCAGIPVGASGGRTPEAEPLDLSGLDQPQGMPEAVDKRSAFDLITAAAYLGGHRPGEATRTYEDLVKRHGRSYESAFARYALQSAVACAWEAGDPALIRDAFSAYDRRLDAIERAPEPRWVGELRCFFRVKDDDRLARAYDQLTVDRQPISDPLLRRRADRWLERHRAASLALLQMFRDDAPEAWRPEILENLVEAEANVRGGYVGENSELLLYSRARELVNGSREAGTATHVVAVAKLFLTATGLVRQPDRREFMLGKTYAPRE